MRFSSHTTGFVATATLAALAGLAGLAFTRPGSPPCAPDNGGLRLPDGFCATLFADSLGGPRHMDVAPNGDLIVAVRATRGQTPMPGGVIVLRDENGDGRADRRTHFGTFSSSEARLLGTALYTETGEAILRYPWKSGSMSPSGPPDTIVAGMPAMGHSAKTFVIQNGRLLVNHGSRTNACQERDRAREAPGMDPCTELQERAGIWRYSAEKKGQTPRDGERFATGIRNAVAMTVDPRSNDLFVVQHGRDQLDNFSGFTAEKNANAPAEELLHVTRGSDFGWPYCYYDLQENRKVLAPEYGGDGKTTGRCDATSAIVGTFPAHWAPNGMLFYTGRPFPERYRSGVFVAFHGSWNRAPLPQQGFNVVFQPMTAGRATGDFEIFVGGFIDAAGKPTELGGRPTGLVQGRDGELYLSDDSRGRIWRIQYVGAGR